MNVGALNQRIIIQSYSETIGTNGESVRTFTTYKTVWAAVKTQGGGEGNQSDEKVGSYLAEFKIRQLGVVPNLTMRILWRSKVYNITSIDSVGMHNLEYFVLTGIAKDNE